MKRQKGRTTELNKHELDKAKHAADLALDTAALEAIYREMNEFLKQCELAGRPKTDEEARTRHARFLELMRRCTNRAVSYGVDLEHPKKHDA
jgi:hypothetical protein